MAAGDFIVFRVYDSTGAPKTDALAAGLAFTAYRNRSGTARSSPTITHLGAGVYRFQPTTSDVAEGIAYVIGTGTGGFPAYYSGAIHTDAQPFASFLLTNQATGALWAGAAPTVGLYVDPSGTARTAPSLATVVSPYLYTLTPSAADLAVGVAGHLTMPSGADPSPAPAFSFAVSSAVDPATVGHTGPQGLFRQQISYAEIATRDAAGRPATMGTVQTSYARVQSTRERVTDHAGEVIQANYRVYLPPSATVGLHHRIWLTSEGDTAGVVSQARRILAIPKFRDGTAAERFRIVYV